MEERNYDEFDYMVLIVKNDIFDEIINNYKCFGWEVDKVVDSSEFFEIKDVTLKRKHKINCKNKLQLEQVYMENEYAKLNSLQKNKFVISKVLGLSVGLLATLFLVCFNIFFAVKTQFVWARVFSIIIACFGVFILIFLLFALKTIKNAEEISFEKKEKQIKEKIEKILINVKEILEKTESGED